MRSRIGLSKSNEWESIPKPNEGSNSDVRNCFTISGMKEGEGFFVAPFSQTNVDVTFTPSLVGYTVEQKCMLISQDKTFEDIPIIFRVKSP
jgi:hypothetical protein